ncbi:MucB/RseB C-terminal domain-containing protein [Ottowia sp.]|uniref:MucB/RseB C-terminal domain-containing protein n=1 Tax=Ottowia sp. TaxID=1898956 RepID=UPI0039E475B1
MALVCCAGGAVGLAQAQIGAFGGGIGMPPVGPQERSVDEWLVRLQQASRVPSYMGTFVVSAASGAMASARIWHVCEGGVQMERVEALSGAPRSTFRRNDAVMTFLPDARTLRIERREGGGVFPDLFTAGALGSTADFYAARQIGEGRVAGFEADIVQFKPTDRLRFGYRIWSEKRTGLVIKTQTLDSSGRVLEQTAFSELQLGAPVNASALRRMMNNTQGYRVEKAERVRTTAEAQGWALKAPVPGFSPQSCYRAAAAASVPAVQWIFSDGLATVSLFMEPFDAARHASEGTATLGATHTLVKRLTLSDADWWVTAVGEVPVSTLQVFIDSLERRK